MYVRLRHHVISTACISWVGYSSFNMEDTYVNEQQANAELTYHEQPERPCCSNCSYHTWEHDNVKFNYICTLSPKIKPDPEFGICAEWKNENLPT